MTAALHQAILHSQESIVHLAERYDPNAKTMAKWLKCTSVALIWLCQPHSTVLTAGQEIISVAFRKLTPLALDDCLSRPSCGAITYLHLILQQHLVLQPLTYGKQCQ
jgi:hypothetical protein